MTEYIRVLRRGLHVGEQKGFALIATLVILGFTSLVLIALLTMTMTVTTVSSRQIIQAREGRAADGAMEAAVNQLVADKTGELGAYGPPSCQPVKDMQIEDVNVKIQCESITSELPPVPTGSKTTDIVRVVGTGYRGDPLSPDSAPNKWQELPTQCILGSACLPWTEAFAARAASDYSSGNPSKLTPASATVIATGGEALWVIGDMSVKKGSASLRNSQRTCPSGSVCPPTVPSYVENGPAFGVSGEYNQGDPGLFDAITPSSPADCGILRENDEWSVEGTQVVGNDGVTCNSANAQALSPAHPTVPAAPYDWTPSRIASKIAVLPAFCPAAKVIELQPGAYTKAQTSVLNQWFLRGNCDNKVFYFRPGNYWFDVDVGSASGLPEAWRNELRFDDSSSLFVFGTPTGGNASTLTRDTRPMCDQSQPGVSITLSARTTVRHLAGRVAVCGGNDHSVAIFQAKSVNLGWEASPTNVTGQIGWGGCTDVVSCGLQQFVDWITGIFGGGVAWQEQWPGYGQWMDASCINFNIFNGAQCRFVAEMSFTGFSGNGDIVGAPIDSATVLVDTDVSVPLTGSTQRTRIDVTSAGATTPLCSVTYPGLADGNFTESYELITNDPALKTPGLPLCGAEERPGLTILRDRLQLYGAKIDVRMAQQATLAGGYSIKINSLKLRTSWGPTYGAINLSAGATQGGGWIGRVNVTCQWEWRTTSWWPYIPYPTTNCPTRGSGVFTVSNLAVTDTFQSSATNPKLTSLGVIVGGTTYGPLGVFDGRTLGQTSSYTVSLVDAGGSVLCSNVYPELANGWDGRETRYLSLMEFDRIEAGSPHVGNGSGSCPSVMRNYKSSDVVGKSIRVKVDFYNWSAPGCLAGLGLLNCDYGYNMNTLKVSATLGDCDTARTSCATTVATAYNGPPTPFRVTSNNQGTINGQPNTLEAAFNIYGNLSIPRLDLDLRWAGPYTVDPVVTGSMWVNAIGSDIKIDSRAGALKPVVGVLCCVPGRPAERVVKLKAWVDDQLRGVAVVHVSDVMVSVEESGACETPTYPPGYSTGPKWPTCDGRYNPGQSTRIELWQLCNNQEDATAKQCFRT